MNDLVAVAPKILAKIKGARKILLSLHHRPDGDSIGGALAMTWVLEQLGKDYELISGDSVTPLPYSCLPGYKKIVHKNYFEVDWKQFDLYIVMDSSSTDQISKIKPVVFPPELVVIVVDHHGANKGFGELNLIDNNAPANCQLLYQLFSEWQIDINRNIAINLLIGIYDDTYGFKYKPSDHLTFEIAAKLVSIYPEYSDVIFEIENNNSAEKIKLMAIALGSIETHLNDRVAISSVTYQQLQQLNIKAEDIRDLRISSQLRSVIGWEVVLSLTGQEPETTLVSLRTRDATKYDLRKIVASIDRKIGEGGGHAAASGAAIHLPILETKMYLLEVIERVFPELGDS